MEGRAESGGVPPAPPFFLSFSPAAGLIVRITGEVTVSALFSPHLWMLRDCKCLVVCHVFVVWLAQFPWLKSGGTRASFGIPDHPVRSSKPLGTRPAPAESKSSSMQTSFTGALTPNTETQFQVVYRLETVNFCRLLIFTPGSTRKVPHRKWRAHGSGAAPTRAGEWETARAASPREPPPSLPRGAPPVRPLAFRAAF